jgi:hypothetical protein
MGIVEEDGEDFLDTASAFDKAQEIVKAEWYVCIFPLLSPSLSNKSKR